MNKWILSTLVIANTLSTCLPAADLVSKTSSSSSASTTNASLEMRGITEKMQPLDYYFLNEAMLPPVISPSDPMATFTNFQNWIEKNQKQLRAILNEKGALLFRGFPVEKAEDFAATVRSVLNLPFLDYRSGEGSRTKIIDGVYTSTEAPGNFQIPLHNELTCTDHPVAYICFYCEVAPVPGTGQTLLGSTEKVSWDLMQKSEVWDLFAGKNLKYISRHPPKGSFFNYVNITHRTWQDAFETEDKTEVGRICMEKGFEFHWLGDWLEVIRLAPAIRGPDDTFDFPYWFNQAHLYHSNPRIRGGHLNDILANLLYRDPTTRQYDIEFEDGTQIPTSVVYEIYDTMELETVKFDWEKGDILILDNKKTLHGKAPHSGERRILVCMIP